MTDGAVSTSVEKLPGEPEMLPIPAEAVQQLLQIAVQSPAGNLWWQGFVTAHGVPSWITNGKYRFATQEARVIPDHSRENGKA